MVKINKIIKFPFFLNIFDQKQFKILKKIILGPLEI